MLTATPTGLFARNYTFALDGQSVGTIEQSGMREKATIEIGGTRYVFSNQLLGSDFLLESNGRPLATARKRTLRRAFGITVGSREFALEVGGTFVKGGRYTLTENGRAVGELVKAPIVRSGRATLPGDLPLPVQVWLLWIGLMMWRRERSN